MPAVLSAALAGLLGLAIVAALIGALAGPSPIGAAATAALRSAGFPDGRVTVIGIGLSADWRALHLDTVVDFGDLAPAGAEYGTALTGSARLAGALAIRPTFAGLAVAPVDCLDGDAEGVSVAGEVLVLPQGVRFCSPESGPAVLWRPGALVLAGRVETPRLELPGRDLRASAVSATLGRTDALTKADLKIGSLSQTRKPAEIVPLSVTARIEQPAGKPITLSATATGARGLLTATATGSHDPATATGTLGLRTRLIRLPPDGPGLAALSPRFGALVEDAAGTVSVRLNFSWNDKGLQSDGRILLEKAAGRIGPVTVAGVNGSVRLSSLSPLVIPDGQLLSVALLDVGLPLTDGTVRFGYGRDGKLDVDAAEWRWAGGTLHADPFELSPDRPDGTVTLHASGVELGRLLSLVQVDGLEAAGTLSGSLPVRIAPDRVRLDGGTLESEGPGTLRYDPANPPAALTGAEGSAGAMLLGALTDFRYDELRLTVDGQAGGELAVGFAVRGANPAFYDGYPVSLNLKVSGALDRILRQSLDAARIPDAVRDRMTEFERKDP